jgi:hypothetical protein
MIPYKPFDTHSGRELAVFSPLESCLDDNFIVFHSVRWITSSKKSQGKASIIVQGSEGQRGQGERRSEQEGQRQRLPKRSNMTVELNGRFIWQS